jgi:hypothetical protein
MIANILNVAVGLWLAYSAIFSTPPGNVAGARLALTAVAAIIFAVWARRSDRMTWQSGSNIVLGAVLLVTAGVRRAVALAPLVCFWVVLLSGIAVAIMAMWSLLYRPETAATSHASPPAARASGEE